MHWFLDAFAELQGKIPRLALINTNSENSAYTNYSTFNKNCYFCFGTHYSEDCYHLQYSVANTTCVDCDDIEKSELCYECVFSEKCYNCSFGSYLMACSDCEFSHDLANCQHCFLCVGLQNQQYSIFNKQLSKEIYEAKRHGLLSTHSPRELLNMLDEFRKKQPSRPVFQKNCENCLGSDLRNSKNLLSCFSVKNGEDIIYGGTNINQCKDSMDVDNIAATLSQDLYQGIGITGGYDLLCCNICWFSQNCSYCELVFNSHDCLGCVGLNHAQYEILNQKYSKEEYFKKSDEIKRELGKEKLWGKMWIPTTYPYEDSIAERYFPT